MRALESCVKCGVAGSVRRELIIKGANMAVSCHCTKCGQRWEIADQRAQSGQSERPPARRPNARH
jgi:hypothetical protein